MTTAFVLSLVFLAAQTTPPPPAQPQPPPQTDSTNPPTPTKPPCRNPDATGKYHIGCGVTSPVLLHEVEPNFSGFAAAKKISTTVLVNLTLNNDGVPENVHVIHSSVDKVDKDTRAAQQEYENSFVEVVRKYRFKPAMFNGKPVPVEMNVEVNIDRF